MLLGTLGASKRVKATVPGKEVKRTGEGIFKSGHDSKCCLIL